MAVLHTLILGFNVNCGEIKVRLRVWAGTQNSFFPFFGRIVDYLSSYLPLSSNSITKFYLPVCHVRISAQGGTKKGGSGEECVFMKRYSWGARRVWWWWRERGGCVAVFFSVPLPWDRPIGYRAERWKGIVDVLGLAWLALPCYEWTWTQDRQTHTKCARAHICVIATKKETNWRGYI